MSASNPTAAEPSEVERADYETFARNHAVPDYRVPIDHAYAFWHGSNDTHFEGQLRSPHMEIGRTPPRRFSTCRLTTNYGGSTAITIAERIAFGTDTRIVRDPWPSQGLIRFLDDLVLAEQVKQFVLEVRGETEDGYGGYGPLFCAEANRIGATLGLPPVLARRRAYRGMGQPVAAFWPWALRPEEYYLGHVRLNHVKVAGLRQVRISERHAAVPGIYEYFLFLLVTGQSVRLTEILGQVVDAEKEARSPAIATFERSPHDATGMPLPMPVIDPAWLTWNAGCVRAIAEGIATRRAWDGMPILADALQDAGCEDPVILDHCRAHADHTGNCWLLRALLDTKASE